MAYSYPEIRNFQGLFLQQNSFSVPDGAMEQAENVVISKDGIINKARGYYNYFTPVSGTYNKAFTYQSKLLAAYANKFAYYTDTGSSPNEVGVEHVLSGETVTITGGRVSHGLQSNNNFYFTTDTGVLKLTSYDSTIAKSGAPQGLDLQASYVNNSTSSWLTSGNIVGYRVLFGYRDANGNLILGAPSDITEIANPIVANVTGTRSGGGPYLITVASTAHGLLTNDYMTFTLHSGSAFNSSATGTYKITVIDANSFSYSVSVDPGAGTGTLDYSYGMPIRLEFSIPSEITTALSWFYQVYRSSQQLDTVGIFSDFKLLAQNQLTSAQITAEVAFYTDTSDDLLLGAELYTNENSQEGELQANYRAPLCDDMTLYKGYAIYGNCTTRQLLSLNVIDPTVMVQGDYIETKIDSTINRYVAQTGVGNLTVTATCSSSSGLLFTYPSHGFSNGDTVYIANIVGGTLTTGTYYVVAKATNTFKISLTNGGSAVAYNSETSANVQGVTNGTNYIFTLSTDSDVSIRLADTAQGIVKAINRDPASLIYAQYVSSSSDVPGKMRLQAKGFGDPIYLRANTIAAGAAFSPALPGSFSVGTQVFSTNDALPNVFFVSKYNEPEAVPLVNFFPVGAKNKAMLRVHALRDSIIIEKEDGVFRVTGDNPNNFSITILDGTVNCVAASSSDVINNQVVFLSNQGVCLVTESSVQIISRRIEDVIQPILGQTGLSAQTAGVAYESERFYYLTTTNPNNTSATQTFAYNILTQAWSTLTTLFRQAVIGPNDVLYGIDTNNNLLKERKKQTKLDYTGQNYAITISSVSSDLMSCNITLPSGIIPDNGDVVVKSNVINKISLPPVLVSGDTYAVVFSLASNLANSDSVILYSQYQSIIKFAPFHAGLVGRSKIFSQMQIHLRDSSTSRLNISFIGDTFGGSEAITWNAILVIQGWGQFPWGFEPWGQSNVINLTIGTQPAPIIRLYVPKFQARNTFLQPYIVHAEAAEPLNIQSLSFAVRAYGERVSR